MIQTSDELAAQVQSVSTLQEYIFMAKGVAHALFSGTNTKQELF